MLRGICYHHAGLTIDERQVLDDAVRHRVLRVIVATTTLAVGVDFPVDVVILNGLKSGTNDLSPSEYKQMAGRAGRRSAGEVFIIETPERLPFALSLLNSTIPPVTSALTRDQRGIDRVLLEAITLGILTTITDMMRYIRISLLSFCVSEDELRRIVLESVGYLQEFQIIRVFQPVSGDSALLLRPSRLGRAISSSLLPIEESVLLYRDLFVHQTHVMLSSPLFLVYLITPTFAAPFPRWKTYEKVLFLFVSSSDLPDDECPGSRDSRSPSDRGELHLLLRPVPPIALLPAPSLRSLERGASTDRALQVLRRAASAGRGNGGRRRGDGASDPGVLPGRSGRAAEVLGVFGDVPSVGHLDVRGSQLVGFEAIAAFVATMVQVADSQIVCVFSARGRQGAFSLHPTAL